MKKRSQNNFIPWRLEKEQYRNTKDQKEHYVQLNSKN